jgi:ABC-type transport system involved in multi-copper enzyme maturation permease subunit
MTAAVVTPSLGALPGFGGLVRKEITEWRRGRRAWVVLIVATLFMVLTAMNAWLNAELAPAEEAEQFSLDPMTNVAVALSAQIFVVIAIFAVMSLIISERESGTLAWTASKPVSRSAIWLAKWISSITMLGLLALLIPLILTAVEVVLLYGPLPILPIVIMAIGALMAIALFVALVLASSTVVTSQAAVAAIGLSVLFLPQLIGALLPIAEYLPTSILEWSLKVASGQPAGFVTPLSWGLSVAALVAFSLRRMERMEL